MCSICTAFRPYADNCDYETIQAEGAIVVEGADAPNDNSSTYTMDVGDTFQGLVENAGDRGDLFRPVIATDVGIVFLLCAGLGMAVSKFEGRGEHPAAIDYKAVDTSTTTGFNLAALAIVLMLAALYIVWW